MAQVTLTCKYCKITFVTLYKYRNKRTLCSKQCSDASKRGKPRKGVPATKATHPQWAAKISATSTARKVNSGSKNGMKQPTARKRVSETRKRKYREEPGFREQTANGVRQAWADGKFDGVAVGRCKWYEHITWKNETIKLQGTWEVAFARYLDDHQIDYTAHQGRWPYVGKDGQERSYYPDFFVPMWNTTVDVKGVYWDDIGAEKFDLIRASNLDKPLLIATRDVLENWGVDIISVQRELLNPDCTAAIDEIDLEAEDDCFDLSEFSKDDPQESSP